MFFSNIGLRRTKIVCCDNTIILLQNKQVREREGRDAGSMHTLLSKIITPFKSSIVIANSPRIKSKFA